MARYIYPVPTVFNNNTPPTVEAGAQLFFFEPGSTTTKKKTFSDPDEQTANANPVILGADGRIPAIFGSGSYRNIGKRSVANGGAQIFDVDNVNFSETQGSFENWDATITYNANDIVEGSDGLFYVSIAGGNLNNDPSTPSPTKWSQFQLIRIWNTNVTYAIDDIVVVYIGVESGSCKLMCSSAKTLPKLRSID